MLTIKHIRYIKLVMRPVRFKTEKITESTFLKNQTIFDVAIKIKNLSFF